MIPDQGFPVIAQAPAPTHLFKYPNAPPIIAPITIPRIFFVLMVVTVSFSDIMIPL
jgi:hypothetical protein